MKAIPTVYRGIRFRSRLEARWAVWFDALGLDWTYEPPTRGGVAYQPDFLIGTFGEDGRRWFIEIKPESWADLSQEVRHRDVGRWQLLTNAENAPLLIFWGPPGTWESGVLTKASPFGWACYPGQEAVPGIEWVECPGCHLVGFVRPGYRIECSCEARDLRLAAEAVRDHSFDEDTGR
jgi:hypothetical protein